MPRGEQPLDLSTSVSPYNSASDFATHPTYRPSSPALRFSKFASESVAGSRPDLWNICGNSSMPAPEMLFTVNAHELKKPKSNCFARKNM